jgi:hypothetical protein
MRIGIISATWASEKATVPPRCQGRLRRSVSQRSGKRRSSATTAGISSPIARVLVSSQTAGRHNGKPGTSRRTSIQATSVLNTTCRPSTTTQKPISACRRHGR